MKMHKNERERELRTQVGVIRGVGAAKTGLFWIRLGIEEEEEEEGLSLAKGRKEEDLFRGRE